MSTVLGNMDPAAGLDRGTFCAVSSSEPQMKWLEGRWNVKVRGQRFLVLLWQGVRCLVGIGVFGRDVKVKKNFFLTMRESNMPAYCGNHIVEMEEKNNSGE